MPVAFQALTPRAWLAMQLAIATRLGVFPTEVFGYIEHGTLTYYTPIYAN